MGRRLMAGMALLGVLFVSARVVRAEVTPVQKGMELGFGGIGSPLDDPDDEPLDLI